MSKYADEAPYSCPKCGCSLGCDCGDHLSQNGSSANANNVSGNTSVLILAVALIVVIALLVCSGAISDYISLGGAK